MPLSFEHVAAESSMPLSALNRTASCGSPPCPPATPAASWSTCSSVLRRLQVNGIQNLAVLMRNQAGETIGFVKILRNLTQQPPTPH